MQITGGNFHYHSSQWKTIIHFHYSTWSIFSSVFFNILKEPLLVQKQTIHQKKGLDLSYLEPEGQGRGSIMEVPRPFGAKSIFCWFFTGAWRVFDSLPSMTSLGDLFKATNLTFWLQIAEIKSYLEVEGEGRGTIMRAWRWLAVGFSFCLTHPVYIHATGSLKNRNRF